MDFNAIEHNIGIIREKACGAKIYAVVKANAYGHGLLPIAERISDKVCGFAVARPDDAFKLRAAGIKNEILALCGFDNASAEELILSDITVTISSYEEYFSLSDTAERLKKTVFAHIKIDSGLNRLGVKTRAEYDKILAVQNPHVCITGVFTHYATADCGDEYFSMQRGRFSAFPKPFDTMVHSANSAAMARGVTEGGVRTGIMLYGYGTPLGQIPALSVDAAILALKTLCAGEKLGYNITYTAPRTAVIAVIGLGYGDGYPRLINKGYVLINGVKCPILGTVCMDMLTADVSGAGEIIPGRTRALILGGRVTADDIAGWAGTISYDILTKICPSGKRVYIN